VVSTSAPEVPSVPSTIDVKRVAKVLLVPSVLLLASCSGSPSTHALASNSEHVLSGPPSHVATATLNVAASAQTVMVKADNLDGSLYRVQTPLNSGNRPLVKIKGNTVRVGQASSGHASARDTLEILLSSNVLWTIDLNGGSSVASIDMEGGALAALNFNKGVSTASVRLPTPHGNEAVHLDGGASYMSIVATSTAPAQVTVAGGASQIFFDGERHEGIAGGTVFEDPTWATAAHRYSIDLASGVSVLRFSRTN
jgi:hypothetical protein